MNINNLKKYISKIIFTLFFFENLAIIVNILLLFFKNLSYFISK